MALRTTLVVWAGVALLVGVAAFTAGRRVAPPAASPSEIAFEVAGNAADNGRLTVHVAGAVLGPGLVDVPAGSRLSDAIAAAGGAGHDADLGAINLAEELVDGTRVVVPRIGQSTDAGGGDGPLRLNQASASELTVLPGIGPVLAQRIVDHRESVGPFETAEDLLDVSGIGERLLGGIRDLVVVP